MSEIVAILRPRDGRPECFDTDTVCSRHGAFSIPRPYDATLTLDEAVYLSDGDGMACDLCGHQIVPRETVPQ